MQRVIGIGNTGSGLPGIAGQPARVDGGPRQFAAAAVHKQNGVIGLKGFPQRLYQAQETPVTAAP
mgnify:CR=1 FL=1